MKTTRCSVGSETVSGKCERGYKTVLACSACKGMGRRRGTQRGFTARVACGCRNGFVDVQPVHYMCVVPGTPEQIKTLPLSHVRFGLVVA